MVTENDRKLRNAAMELHYLDWGEISDMIKKADSEETKTFLHNVQVNLYHLEEAHAGDL